MLGLAGVFAAAVGPALFWLWFVWRRDRFEAEPRRLVASTFLIGALVTIPAALAELALGADLKPSVGITVLALSTVGIVGPIEEVAKFAVVRLWPYRKPAFNEPMDGLVYAAAAAMGFAGLENLLYVAEAGPAVMLVRGPFSTLAHLLFALPYGYALGRAKVGTGSSFAVAAALVAAAIGHGLFDFFISSLQIASYWSLLVLLIVPLMIVLWWLGASLLRRADRESPFRR